VNKFFLMTRGRTGSTAVIDELNKKHDLRATHELFLKYDFNKLSPDYFKNLYDMLLPFVLWKQKDWSRKWLPHFLYNNQQWSGRYLAKAESLARREEAKSFGFKVLSHNFEEWSFLSAVLKQRDYQTIYLTRNIARQVLSGMAASQRGFYNTRESFDDVRRYQIDLDKFQWLVEWEKQAIEKDCAQLTAQGFRFIVVTYEEFCADRQSFYNKIFHFLDLSTELPPRSDWTVLIKDLKYTIANYDEVVERAAAIGMPLDL
jgi:hypothetical protein